MTEQVIYFHKIRPVGVDSEDKKRKLAKRLADITTRLEEVSNSIYKIEQRLELIEKKMNIKDH